jgi:hypothetical protein
MPPSKPFRICFQEDLCYIPLTAEAVVLQSNEETAQSIFVRIADVFRTKTGLQTFPGTNDRQLQVALFVTLRKTL